jgi:serine/threonine-protein kinase
MNQALEANTNLSHYRILSRIGAGGMGEVYLAEDTKLDRRVALKILPADVALHPDRMKRFVQEAKAASALNHPNIITIHEIDETDSINFMAIEFVDGETLRERLRRAPMKLGETLDVAAQIASALSAAHAAGIVHRDIKPENVMIRRDGIVKVLDFGLAKLIADQAISVDTQAATKGLFQTDPGTIVGTAAYMSPEQARGLPVDARTDIFSLGVVIYEMVAGQAPFGGATRSDLIVALLEREPAPLARFTAQAPAELDRLVMKALVKDRDERYQTAKDLLIDLKRLKQKLEVDAEIERSGPREEFRVPAPVARLSGAETSPPKGDSLNGATAQTAVEGPRATAGADSVVTSIKQHKLAAIAALLVLAVTITSLYYFTRGKVSNKPNSYGAIESIAVLPFENTTHDQKLEYLSDGITESLINSLSQLPHIAVIARSSAFRYKNQTPDLQQVGQQLNVQAVLTGRVLVQGDTLGVSVELTNTQNNTQLWGQRYTRKAADIFAVQDEIAQQVTDALRVRLTGVQQGQVTKRYTENAEAYRLYLLGRYYMNGPREEYLKRAIPFFDQAIALDPRYALAYAARGESFFEMGDLILPMNEAMSKARQDVTLALSIDDKLVEARTTLANIKFQYDWDFARAEEDFKQVIALNPNYAEAHHQYGAYYLPLSGRPLEGVAEMKLAQQLDPVNPIINLDLCLPYYLARQYDQSIAQTRKAIEMFPDFFLPHLALGQALIQKGDYSTGIAELEKAKAMEPTPLVIGSLGYAYAKSGRKDEARKLLAELKEQSKGRYVAAYWIARIYVGLDEKDEAFAWLEKAYQDRSWWLVWIKMEPQLDSLRSDSRFKGLMLRVGFSP